MGRSQRPSHLELAGMVRLAGECRDLAHDSDLWHRHCLEGLRRMLGAFTGTGGEGIWLRPGNPVCPRQVISVGMPPDSERLFRTFVERDRALGTDPFFRALALRPEKLITFRRIQLVPDGDWYSAPSVMEVRRLAGSDDVLNTTLQLGTNGATNVLTLQRAWGDAAFSERDRRRLHAFHLELAPLIGTVLATIDSPGVRDLTRRQRQTLELLMLGMSHKQVAFELGLSPTTARDYVDQLKVRFGVHTTPELICKYLGRNRAPSRGCDGDRVCNGE